MLAGTFMITYRTPTSPKCNGEEQTLKHVKYSNTNHTT